MPPFGYITRYWLSLLVAAAAISCIVLAANLFVDPLWYGAGNKISGENYTYNERVTKTNLLIQTRDQYDCLILGSSRVTLLNPHRIKGYSCFNYAFSGGVVDEFFNFARYFIRYAGPPKLIIVGVDGESLVDAPRPANAPDFVVNLRQPPSPILRYLSLDAFALSLRTLNGQSPLPRYYNDNFVCEVLPNQPAYSPPNRLFASARPKNFDPSRVKLFRDLRELFPASRVEGYVPPKSSWVVTQFEIDGTLGGYLQAMFETSHVFDRFLDFSIPSKITADRTATYDGSHFYPWVNDRIARALNGRVSGFGLRVDTLRYEEYRSRFIGAVDKFRAVNGIEIMPNPRSAPRPRNAGATRATRATAEPL